jgi:membrane protease YdiL (CAAX protease family)/dsDNA-binding SOS-regulon protein
VGCFQFLEGDTLYRKQKLSVLLITLGTLILATVPIGIRNLFFVVDNASTNDLLVSIIFPTLTILLLLLLPFLATRIFPVLSGFDLTWTRKPRAKIHWYFILFFTVLLSGFTIRIISHHTGLLTMKFFNYKDVTQLTLAFFIFKVLYTAILTPIAEEVFYRGFLQDQFSKCFGIKFALFLQAFLFALVHGRPFLGFVHIYLFGLIVGCWWLKRRSLVPIIIVHIVMNSLWCLVYYPDQYEMSKKDIAVNYVEVINSIGGNISSEDNADADYQKALGLYVRPSDELFDYKLLQKNWLIDDLTDEQQQALKQWVTQNKDALIQFRLATQKPFYWPHYDGNEMLEADIFMGMSQLRELFNALIWKAQFHISNGAIEQAIDELVCCFRFGNHSLIGPKPMVSFIIGMGVKGVVCGTLFRMIDNIEVDANQLESLQGDLQQEYQNNPSTLDLTWEKFILYDTIQQIFTDDGDGNGHIPRAELKGQNVKMLKMLQPDLSDEQIERWNQSDRKTTTKLVDELSDFLNAVFPQTPSQLKNKNIDIRSKIEETMADNVLYPYTSGIATIHQIFHKNRAVQDALMATLAILRYEKTNNRFPENLEILVSEGYLDFLPIDPFSDQPLVYKTDNGNFLLYSVGKDFDDDGGLHDDKWGEEDGDYVFWPVQSDFGVHKTVTQPINK